MAQLLNTNEFIERCNNQHNNFYNYKDVIYINGRTKINIICPVHGVFFQKAKNHLYGQGCDKCTRKKRVHKNNNNKKYTNEGYIEKAILIHGDLYDYSELNYNGYLSKITIICKIHGQFEQYPGDHLSGCGCSKCQKMYKYTNVEYISECNKTHHNKYDYSKCNYINYFNKVCIICPEHGLFYQRGGDHLRGNGCWWCTSSAGENKITDYLNKLNINYTREKIFKDCLGINNGSLRFDFYLPDFNICIEFDGEQHFKPVRFRGMTLEVANYNFQIIQQNDQIKDQYCKKTNIQLIRIPFTEINNIEKLLVYLI